ncbi:MAG: 30S ribosome-binding factor RbfA [Candidatus Nanopelagicales bacterium]
MNENLRARQLAKRIQEIVAEAIEFRVKDARLGFVTITDARLTNDFREATLFYTVFGTPEEREATAAALETARGQIRTEVGRRMGIKHTPSLTFIVDRVPETSAHLEGLLREMHQADAELQKVREGASYAGEADPYKHDDEEDGEDD